MLLSYMQVGTLGEDERVIFASDPKIGPQQPNVSSPRVSAGVTQGLRSEIATHATSKQQGVSIDEPSSRGFRFRSLAEKIWHGISRIPHHWTHDSAMPVIFGFGMLTVFLCAIVDFRTHSRADPEPDSQTRDARAAEAEDAEKPTPHQDSGIRPTPPERSFSVMVLLTSYRFYTGFLGATWVPFLIAKEGSALTANPGLLSTASFMGIEKMIYGFSLFLNPFFGLLSDKLAATAPWGGRSAFLLAGVGLAGIGIYAAKLASESGDIMWYLGSSCLWMLGEAMADITTESVAPELLPPSQYDTASAIRSMHHLLGALVGYVALIVAAAGELHWRWLYVAYMGLMLLFALPTVACMRRLQGGTPRAGPTHTGPALASLFEAYIAPTRYAGGFPRACLSMGIFSLGTGPLFFTLLMLHDLVGLESAKAQQLHFSAISITFLLGACITALCSATSDKAQPGQATQQPRLRGHDDESSSSSDEGEPRSRAAADNAGGGDAGAGPAPNGRDSANSSARRWCMMFSSTAAFGVVCCVMPVVSLPPSASSRLQSFYIVSFFLGLAFGSVYARFQACTWTLLPAHVDIANAMGFAAVAKLVGAGLGNFIAGCILDSFRSGIGVHGHNYKSIGYTVMCWESALCVFISAGLVCSIARKNRLLLSSRRWFCLC